MVDKNYDIAIANLEENIKKYEDKSFNVYFFVYDTKGKSSGELSYIYRTALTLSKLGYKVAMLYQLTAEEKRGGETFIGVEGWLGEEMASLTHYNIEDDNVEISPADFIFFPEVFSDAMAATVKSPCKRIAILHNFSLIHTFMPTSRTWPGLGIRDAVVTTKRQAELLDGIFKDIRVATVRPCIAPVFEKNEGVRDLSINIVARDPSDFGRITKLFYWKYPYFKWVRFNELTDISQEVFAENLKNSPFTVWVDSPTQFGYSALEAMKCGSIVIGKVPEEEPEWMFKNGKFRNNGIWFYNINDVHDIIAGAIDQWIADEFPIDEYQSEADETVAAYDFKIQEKEIEKVYVDGYFAERKNELVLALNMIKNNKEKEENKETNE